MTTEVLSELTQNAPLPKRQNMWFVHDGAAVHFSPDETQFYKTVCPNRCVERKRTSLWPPRSPNILPGYFCLCSRLKSTVCLKRVTLKHKRRFLLKWLRLNVTCLEFLQRTGQSLCQSAQFYIRTNGHNFW
jgi:hypothetical protein